MPNTVNEPRPCEVLYPREYLDLIDSLRLGVENKTNSYEQGFIAFLDCASVALPYEPSKPGNGVILMDQIQTFHGSAVAFQDIPHSIFDKTKIPDPTGFKKGIIFACATLLEQLPQPNEWSFRASQVLTPAEVNAKLSSLRHIATYLKPSEYHAGYILVIDQLLYPYRNQANYRNDGSGVLISNFKRAISGAELQLTSIHANRSESFREGASCAINAARVHFGIQTEDGKEALRRLELALEEFRPGIADDRQIPENRPGGRPGATTLPEQVRLLQEEVARLGNSLRIGNVVGNGIHVQDLFPDIHGSNARRR